MPYTLVHWRATPLKASVGPLQIIFKEIDIFYLLKRKLPHDMCYDIYSHYGTGLRSGICVYANTSLGRVSNILLSSECLKDPHETLKRKVQRYYQCFQMRLDNTF